MPANQTHSKSETSPALPEIPVWLCLSLLALFCLILFRKVLFLSPQEVLSDPRWDLNGLFIHRRFFGFNELKSGNLALWNPHCAFGMPFFGNFEPALLYPLNFLYLLLPLVPAINWTIALHVFLGGAFTFFWTRSRGLHSVACLLAAFMFMCCGPHFLQIYVGHLSNLATLIWAPLLFLAIDKVVDRPSLSWCLFGMFVVTMAILAGHPQYVFYLGVAAGIYSLLNLARAERRGRVLLTLAAIAIGGAALSAVQLFTGFQESRESMRSLGMSYEFASSFSFPPENFLTLIAPWSLGTTEQLTYIGRWYLSEVSLFVSVMGLVLAVFGMTHAPAKIRRFSITLLVTVLVLAMGCYTPVFPFLFHHVPGFNLFRGMDKFIWLAALFLSMLAAIGLDQLLRRAQIPWALIIAAAVLGIGTCLFSQMPARLDWWAGVLQSIVKTASSMSPPAQFSDPQFIAKTSAQACLSLFHGGVTLLVAAGLLVFARSRRDLACAAMLLLALFELTSFANASLASFKPTPPYSPDILKLLANNPGDYRIFHSNPSSAMTTGALDISGDDPTGLLRSQRFLNFAQGLDPDLPAEGIPAKIIETNSLRMVRLRYGFSYDEKSGWVYGGGLPQLSLVDHFVVMTNYHEILPALTNANFDLHHEVILESQPNPAPQSGAATGTVKLRQSSTDYLVVEADVTSPTLLLITDAYSTSWRALSLPGSSQTNYQIMPANYCLRAIPLQAGHHLIRVEYAPLGFRIGRVVSLAALSLFLILSGWSINMRPGHLTGSRLT